MGPAPICYDDQGAGAYDPARKLYLRTARIDSRYGIVMWNVATPDPANNPIEFVPRSVDGQFACRNCTAWTSTHGARFSCCGTATEKCGTPPPASGPAFTATGWTVAPAPVSGANVPALTHPTGVLGKWKYLRSHDVMVGLGGGFEGQVWVYKPLGWRAP